MRDSALLIFKTQVSNSRVHKKTKKLALNFSLDKQNVENNEFREKCENEKEKDFTPTIPYPLWERGKL